MGRVITATEARIHFGELIRDVWRSKQAVIVERGGKPQVVVLSINEYENLLAGQAQREDWRTLLAQAHERFELIQATNSCRRLKINYSKNA